MGTTTANRVSSQHLPLTPARAYRAMSTTPGGDALRVVSLSVEQYDRMIESGLLPEGEPIELLDGVLVWKDRATRGEDPMTVGEPHGTVIERLTLLQLRLVPFPCRIRVQLPIRLPPSHEPEPDGAIVRGAAPAGRHPGSGDVFCVIEAADSSLERDRGDKRRIYADAGIPQYVIVNIPDKQIEVHEQPLAGQGRYAQVEIIKAGQNVVLLVGEGKRLELPAAELLP